MQGDIQDIVSRLRQVLPSRWFPDCTPVLDIVLTGTAWVWASLYSTLQFVRQQSRITTADGVWLDLTARDYFGSYIYRRSSESDPPFRERILAELVRERGTRHAIAAILRDLTGRQPLLFEPSNVMDTGGYGGGVAYGVAGGWGSLQLPFQFFVTAFRPIGEGVSGVSGWNCDASGYGCGTLEYASLSEMESVVSDLDIYAGVQRILPVGTVSWVRITN